MLIASERTRTVTPPPPLFYPLAMEAAESAPRQIIRRYILENFLFSDDSSAIDDEASFLTLGIIDSVGALEIALFLEQQFGFAVKEDEMLPENLDSVSNLVAFVERRMQ